MGNILFGFLTYIETTKLIFSLEDQVRPLVQFKIQKSYYIFFFEKYFCRICEMVSNIASDEVVTGCHQVFVFPGATHELRKFPFEDF
jgi:hypothetical protein